MTDAVNVAVYATDSQRDAAIWHIFPYDCNDRIRQYLRARDPRFERDNLDPILSQSVYISPSMLEELASQYNVRPWVIKQHANQMVLIPAGCAHQVLVMKALVF